MTTLFKALFCVLSSAIMFSCSKNQHTRVSIEFDKQHAGMLLPDKSDGIEIISGNGRYSLVFPKVITAYDVNGGNGVEIPYSEYFEAVLSVRLDGSNNIALEWKGRFDLRIEGVFMVKDGKGARRLFQASCLPLGMSGLPSHTDSVFGHLLNDKDYWVNY